MCDYLDVADVVKIRIEFTCNKRGLKPLVATKYSDRRADSFLYTVMCKNLNEEGYSVWHFNSSTHLLFEGVFAPTLSDAFKILADKIK